MLAGGLEVVGAELIGSGDSGERTLARNLPTRKDRDGLSHGEALR